MQKLYEAVIEIRNGEYTYNNHKLTYAENNGEALDIFRDFYCNYYGEGEEVESDINFIWFFNNGEIAVTLASVTERTMEEWKDREFNRILLGNISHCSICENKEYCGIEYKNCRYNLDKKEEVNNE